VGIREPYFVRFRLRPFLALDLRELLAKNRVYMTPTKGVLSEID
jgi:hypothetical protein